MDINFCLSYVLDMLQSNKELTQGHTATEWQSQMMNMGIFDS